MSLETDFFGRSRPAFAKMEAAGFQRTESGYRWQQDFMDGQFRAVLEVGSQGGIRGQVIDLDTGEEYLPIRAKNQTGEFVGSVRQEYLEVLAQVRDAGFVPVDFLYDQSNRIAAMIEAEFGDTPEFPWEKYPGNGTFKSRVNGKWYAVILTVAYGKLEIGAEENPRDPEMIAEVINLKADPEKIPALTREHGICPAWHMNKKHWISVLLDDTLTDRRVMELIRESCWLVSGKAAAGHVNADAWIIPSNPKVYDIDAGFEAGGGSIEWHQHNNIKPGDEVYIYSAAPNSAIMYRCFVEESDLRYHGMFVETKGYTRSMRIRLIEKYPKTRFTLGFMREHGGSPVRSARRMPEELLRAIRQREEG
ncbi:MAG: MmcQ/YjbR family DNA-binding protein [Firmicutes bacterium]|nr:MmcQ/YjbR family DNA-binding protein [Bacillota bacterium]